jgi:hypothetical protein
MPRAKLNLCNGENISKRLVEYDRGMLDMEEITELFHTLIKVGYLPDLSRDYLSVCKALWARGELSGYSCIEPEWLEKMFSA